MSNKTDFKKELKHLYRPSAREFEVVDVPPMSFLMIDGHGDPNTAQEYKDAVEALYTVAYRLKFMSKNDLGRDYVVPPMEGLWWVEQSRDLPGRPAQCRAGEAQDRAQATHEENDQMINDK